MGAKLQRKLDFSGKKQIFLKKVAEKFGWFRKSVYLCNRKSRTEVP